MPSVFFCTKHQKGKLVAEPLRQLGYHVEECQDFDTDTLGTFSGEKPRTLTPNEAALYKAKQATMLTESRYGLGSEGSFGGGPYPGFVNWNHELLCWYDSQTDQAFYAFAEGPTSLEPVTIENESDVTALSLTFANQRWLLQVEDKVLKGLDSSAILVAQDQYRLSFPFDVMPDLRAMYCPERQLMIRNAASDLARRLTSTCPQCDAPNFVVKQVEKGLACSVCHTPTSQIKTEISVCDHCHFTCKDARIENTGNPTYCPVCNP